VVQQEAVGLMCGEQGGIDSFPACGTR
jgi:hypothetical protein